MTVKRDDVVKQLAEIQVTGNEDGLIPAYNVLVNQLPTSFWNTFAERMVAVATEAGPEVLERVKAGLIRAAYECGYHTGYGIITSEEFKSVVEPMVTEGAKDVLRGAYAVFTAWGWAKSGIVQNKEGQRMVVRATDYYESNGEPGEPRAFMITGVTQAFYELAYAEPYPNGMDTFKAKQTKGIECGDKFGEFVVEK